jgi:hypothetical protein
MVASDERRRVSVAGLAQRPQDYLPQPIAVGVREILLEGHRADPEVSEEFRQVIGAGQRKRILPICVTRNPTGHLVLLSGERRLRALVANGVPNVNVYVVSDWAGLAAWLVLDARSEGRTRMKPSEVGTFTGKAIAALRLNGTEISQLDETVGEQNDFRRTTVRESRWMAVRAAALPAGPDRDATRADIRLVDLGIMAPTSVLGRIIQRQRKRERAASALPAADQRKTFNRVMPMLNGAAEGLENLGPLDPDLSIEECAAWEDHLRRSIRILSRLAREFKTKRETTS